MLTLNQVFCALAAPHILYAFIWFYPNTFRSIVGRKPVEKFAAMAVLLKLVQFLSVLGWLASETGMLTLNHWLAFLPEVSPLQWLVFFACNAAGQSLNAGIFKAIGTAGVYYGFKLGHKVPWHKGFPFNVVPHPQYVGSALSVWGFYALLCGVAPSGLLAIALYWTGLYVVTAIWEDYTS